MDIRLAASDILRCVLAPSDSFGSLSGREMVVACAFQCNATFLHAQQYWFVRTSLQNLRTPDGGRHVPAPIRLGTVASATRCRSTIVYKAVVV